MSQSPATPGPAPHQQPHAVRPGRRRWFVLFALTLGLVGALVLGELLARCLGATPLRLDDDWQQRHASLYQSPGAAAPLPYGLRPLAETNFAYRGPPVHYRINEDGLRADRRYARPKPPGVRRILMLGDSVLFGLGVPREQTFAARVESALPGVEVINAGVGGYNTAAERLWFEAAGREYQPDAIVLCHCPNDVDDPIDHFSAHTVRRLTELPDAFIPNPAYHARRVAEIGAAPAGWRQSAAAAATWTMQRSALATMSLRILAFGGASHTYERCLRCVADNASPELEWLRREFTQLASSTGVPVFFVYLPLAYELRTGDASYRAARDNVIAVARAAGLRPVDLFAALESTGQPYLDVSHLSPAGHAAVAELLADALREAKR